MHIVVCLKQVVDPEIPPQQFQVDRDAKIQVRGDLPLVMGNFDGCALELGLQLKAAVNGRVTALSLGPATARDMLKSALAMGADDAVLLSDPAFEGGDSFATARALVAAIRKLPPADVILCGRQASDYEVGQVGGCLAEALGFPLVSLARQLGVVVGGGRLSARRQADGWDEIVEVEPPAVVTVTNDDHNVPRLATVRGLLQAGRRQIPTWGLAELGLAPDEVGRAAARTEVVALDVLEVAAECEMINGANPTEQAAALVPRLKDLQLI